MSEEVKEDSEKWQNMDPQAFQTFTKDAIHLAMLHGFLVLQSYSPYAASIINMSLEPVAKSKKWMDTARLMATELGQIMRNMIQNEEYVNKIMTQMSEDPFLKGLLDLKKYAKENQSPQRVVFYFERTDFMEDMSKKGDAKISLVETNTIAASLCSHVTATAKTQQDLYQKYPQLFPPQLTQENWLLQPALNSQIMKQFACALDKYCEIYKKNKEDVIMLIAMNHQEWNSFDTYHMEHTLWKEHKYRTMRCELEDIAIHSTLEVKGNIKTLFYKKKEVAMVYYRTGYIGAQYHKPAHWEARKIVEISSAIKLPTVEWQIIGLKRFQMELGKPAIQQLFKISSYSAKEVLEYLCDLGDESDPITQGCLKSAKEKPDYFVLKSINEGGGGNYYGTDILNKIDQLKEKHLLPSHMLVRRFYPTAHTMPILTKQKIIKGMSVLDEIGIYHGYVGERDESGKEVAVLDEVAGYLIRSKESSKTETAISYGGAIGSIYLKS